MSDKSLSVIDEIVQYIEDEERKILNEKVQDKVNIVDKIIKKLDSELENEA